MSLVNAIIARLSQDPEFGEAVGDRIGPSLILPSLPAASIRIVYDRRPQHLKGAQGIRSTLVQVDVIARTFDEADRLGRRCIAILLPATLADGIRFQRGMVAGHRVAGEIGNGPHPAAQAARSAPQLFRASVDLNLTHNAP